MKESNQIIASQYLHKGNVETPYLVLGLAQAIESIDNLPGVTEIGIALGVAGYEETGKVTSEQIKVVQITEAGSFRLGYVKIGSFKIPDTVVAYKQLRQGNYPVGQLWWRPVENFHKHFSLSPQKP